MFLAATSAVSRCWENGRSPICKCSHGCNIIIFPSFSHELPMNVAPLSPLQRRGPDTWKANVAEAPGGLLISPGSEQLAIRNHRDTDLPNKKRSKAPVTHVTSSFCSLDIFFLNIRLEYHFWKASHHPGVLWPGTVIKLGPRWCGCSTQQGASGWLCLGLVSPKWGKRYSQWWPLVTHIDI